MQTLLAVGLSDDERTRLGPCENLDVVDGTVDEDLTESTAVIVIGAGVSGPLGHAQRVRRDDRLVSVLVLLPSGDPDGIVASALATPFLGQDVTFRPVDDEDLPGLVQTLAESTRQRRRYERLVEAAGNPLELAAPPWRARTRRYLGTLLDHAPFGAALLDGGGRVVAVNQRGKEMIGEEKAILGRPFADLLDPFVQSVWIPVLGADSERRDSLVLPFRVTEESWLEAVVAPEGGVEAGAGCLVIIHDVTERERAREDRRLAERRALESQHHETVGVLAGGVAHDFNNLLTAVLGNLDLLLREVPEGSAGREHLDAALEAVEAAARLVSQLLAYAGRGIYQIGDLDPALFLREAHPFLAHGLSGEHELELTIEPVGGVISGDRAGLQQLVFNLLQNADEAMAGRTGTLGLSLRPVVAEGRGGNEAARTFAEIEVRDQGVGIADDVLPRVFEPFFSTKGLGSGLGLPAARGIAEALGGSLKLETRPGKGTTVTVRLPLTIAASERADRDSTPPA